MPRLYRGILLWSSGWDDVVPMEEMKMLWEAVGVWGRQGYDTICNVQYSIVAEANKKSGSGSGTL